MTNQLLQAARKKKYWSQAQAAQACGVDVQTYYRWERGSQLPHGYNLGRLCEVLDTPAKELGYASLLQEAEETELSPEPVVLAPSDGLILLGREQAEWVTDVLNAEGKQMNQSMKDALAKVLNTNEHLSVPLLQESSQSPLLTATTSRRQAIAAIIGVTAAALGLSQELGLPRLHPEEALLLCTSNIPLCWSLYFEGGLAETKQSLTPYLSQLSTLASSPTSYQKQAAGLASQAYQLSALIEILFHNLGIALDHAKRAVVFARLTDDVHLLTAAHIRLAVVYSNLNMPWQRLTVYEQALQQSEPSTPLLQARVYAGLTETHSALKDEKAARRFLELTQTTVPVQYETDPNFSYTHFDPWSIQMYEKDMYLNLGKPAEAWKVLEQSHTVVEQGHTVNRVDLTVKQAEVAFLLGNLEQSCTYLLRAAEGAVKLGSQLLARDVSIIYLGMRQKWPQERSVLEVGERLQGKEYLGGE